MRPGMQIVLDVLRSDADLAGFPPRAAKQVLKAAPKAGRKADAKATPRAGSVVAPVAAAIDDEQWRQAFALAAVEHVLPWFANSLRFANMELSPEIEALLSATEREVGLDGFFWSVHLRSLLQAFAAAGVPVLPLKGPALAERVYGQFTLRSSRDLDLLVRPADLREAEAVLTRLGFAPEPYPDDYHRPWLCCGVIVELHFNVENPLAFDFDLESAWQNATVGTFQGQPAWQFAPADELLYLSLHGARHRYERLSYILDLALALRTYPHLAEPPALRPQVKPLGGLLTLGVELATLLFPETPFPRPPLPVGHAAHLRAIAEERWKSLLERPGVTLDWRAQHRFYVATELTFLAKSARQLRHLGILVTRVIQEDYEFATRLGLYRTWQVWLLRPLRLLLAKPSPR